MGNRKRANTFGEQNLKGTNAYFYKPLTKRHSASLLSSAASMATWWRPRSRAIPFLPLLILAPLFYSISRLQLIWAPPPERGQCLPPPTALKHPDRLMLGPAAGQGRPNRLYCHGLKAVNKIG